MSQLEQTIRDFTENMDRIEARIAHMLSSVVIGEGEPEFCRRPTQPIHPALLAALKIYDAEVGGGA